MEAFLQVHDDKIPTRDSLGLAWLRQVAPQFDPQSVEVSPIGTGQLAETYRLALDGGAMRDGGPRSVVCKIASSDPSSREIAGSWSLYQREVRFYRELAPTALVDVPGVYATGLADDGTFFILMEDVQGAKPGNQLAGMTVEDARRAVLEAARLHASFWGRGEEPAFAWLETGRIAQAFYPAEVFRQMWPGFRERYADLLAPEHVATCDDFAEFYDGYSAPLDRPRCVVHNDFRADNMLFAPERLAVLDWQSVALGFNAVDVAYVIGGGFDPEQRRAVEAGLLDTYHDELLARGVAGYARQDLAQDYRHFTFAGIVVSVCAAMLVKRTERGDRMFLTMLDRHVRHVRDCNGVELLRERA